MTPNGKSAIFQVKFRFPKRKDFIGNLKVFIFCEQQSALTREKLEELVRRLVEEKLASLPVSSQEADPAVEEELDSDISQMLENLELFQS